MNLSNDIETLAKAQVDILAFRLEHPGEGRKICLHEALSSFGAWLRVFNIIFISFGV